MSILYDLYQPGSSWLHRLDPRVKLLGALCFSLLGLLCRNLWLMLGMVALGQGALWSARISGERLRWIWRVTLPTMVMIALLWVVVYPGQGKTLFAWWILRLTPRNLAQGLAVALRIAVLALGILAWLLTTSQTALVHSLVRLGLPDTWGLTLGMALRYLPTMAGTFRLISEAQQARALDLTKGNPFQRARAYIPITVAMLITALRTAENLSRALESRALGSGRKRTYLHELRLRRVDWAWIVVILSVTLAWLWARYALGWGADPLRLWL